MFYKQNPASSTICRPLPRSNRVHCYRFVWCACFQQVPRGRLAWNMDIHIIYVTVEHLNQVICRKCIQSLSHTQIEEAAKVHTKTCTLSLLSHHNYYMRRNIKTYRKSLWKWELLLGYQWNIQKLEIHIIYYTQRREMALYRRYSDVDFYQWGFISHFSFLISFDLFIPFPCSSSSIFFFYKYISVLCVV